MRGGYYKFIKLLYLAGDLGCINLAFFMAIYWIMPPSQGLDREFVRLSVLANLIWVLLSGYIQIIDIKHVVRLDKIFIRLFNQLVFYFGIIFSILFFSEEFHSHRAVILRFFIFFFLLVIIWRLAMYFLLKYYRASGYNYRVVLIIGAGAAGKRLLDYLMSDRSIGYKVLGIVDDSYSLEMKEKYVIGKLKDIEQVSSRFHIDEVFCALPLTDHKQISNILNFCENKGYRFKLVPDFQGIYNKFSSMDFLGNIPVISVRQEPLESLINRGVKRSFDILFSLFVMLFIFPVLFPVIYLMIKLSSRGPVFFRQMRTGRKNRKFFCYKFRSMEVNKASDLKQASIDDQRMTKVGRILRKTNLDELPQFYNVFIGNMSVVGPRPHMLRHTDEYSKLINKYMIRHFVKPGITGWAQVHGFRGGINNRRMLKKRIQYDVWYIEHWTFWLDIQIIIMTITNMFKGEKNAY